MGDQSRDRIKRALYVRENLRLGIVVERAGVGDLPAGFRVNHRAVKNHLRRLASFYLRDRTSGLNYGFNPGVLRSCRGIKICLCRTEGGGNLRVSRFRRFLRGALPGSPRPFPLLAYGPVKPLLVKWNFEVPSGVHNEI